MKCNYYDKQRDVTKQARDLYYALLRKDISVMISKIKYDDVFTELGYHESCNDFVCDGFVVVELGHQPLHASKAKLSAHVLGSIVTQSLPLSLIVL